LVSFNTISTGRIAGVSGHFQVIIIAVSSSLPGMTLVMLHLEFGPRLIEVAPIVIGVSLLLSAETQVPWNFAGTVSPACACPRRARVKAALVNSLVIVISITFLFHLIFDQTTFSQSASVALAAAEAAVAGCHTSTTAGYNEVGEWR
jgi:hypothetical protein